MAPGALISFLPQAETLTYEAFFGLKEKAFSLNADPRFLFPSSSHATALENLAAGIRRREGLLVLTGEIGTGKTMLCQAVLKNLGRKTFSSFVPDPFASREDLLKMLLLDFGVLTVQELTTGALQHASRTELSYLLSGFLESLAPLDAFVVVVIDEAQNMSLPLIEETRILSDSFGGKGGLQIVFVGQPELRAKMKLPEMRQVDQRVCSYNHLAPLTREAVAGYIQHRLSVAGLSRERVLFAPDVVDVLHRRTGGVPRLINRVCDRALHLAHLEQAAWVNKENLETALIDIGPSTLTPTWDAIICPMPAVSEQPVAAIVVAPEPVAAAELATAPEPVTAPPLAKAARPSPEAFLDTVDHIWDVGPIDGDAEDFDRTVDEWLTQELEPTFRKCSPPRAVASLPADSTRPETPAVHRTVVGREPSPKSSWIDTQGELRSETYVHRQVRLWSQRAAVAVLCLAGVGAGAAGISGLPGKVTGLMSTPAVLPALPVPPAFTAPGLVAVVAPAPEAAAAPTPAPVVRLAPAPAGDYLVAVGLFANLERADGLVRELTQAGLPAIQQPYQFRNQQVRRVLLGPFTSRADAFTGLLRLRQLGGHDDANVVETIGESASR